LLSLRMHPCLSFVVLNKYYEDSGQSFGAFSGFL
jgi:hypothetical protein